MNYRALSTLNIENKGDFPESIPKIRFFLHDSYSQTLKIKH